MKVIGIASLAFAVMTVTGAANADPVKLGAQKDKTTTAQVKHPGHLVLTDTQMGKITAGYGGNGKGYDGLMRGGGTGHGIDLLGGAGGRGEN
jgi:hypothetical protein